MKAIEDTLGVHPGQTTADGLFTFTEVECLGACANAPMIQINDDFYEDLTYESTAGLLKALKAAAEQTGASGMAAGMDAAVSSPSSSGERGAYVAGGVKVPAPGPLSGRQTCENSAGITSLKEVEPWSDAKMRQDGAL